MSAKESGPQKISFTGDLGHIARLPDGRLVSVYSERFADGHERIGEDNPALPAYLRYSEDHGRTWSEPRVGFSYAPGPGLSGSALPLVDPQGTLHVLSLRFFRIGGDWAGEAASHSTVLHHASRDGGESWSEVHAVDYGKSYTGALNSAIALSSGRLLLALSCPSDRFGGRSACVSTCSDDEGRTWQPGNQELIVPDGEELGHPGALEPILLELGSGRVWMIIRTQMGYFYQSFSADDGKTWSEPARTAFRAPNAPGGICRLDDGRIVLCWNDLSQYPEGAAGSKRQFLHAALAENENRSFGRSREIARIREGDLPDTNVAYPFLCPTADGQILVLYYRVGCAPEVTWWTPRIEVVKLDPDWIAAA